MQLIPAIDIRGGRCVRLQQGQPEKQTVYESSPADVAQTFYTAGATRIHIVDLDGAFEGRSKNQKIVTDILAEIPVEIELGGGIRNLSDIEYWLKRGIHSVILGTAAVQSPELVEEAISEFSPDRILIGMDTNNGFIATHGWQQFSEIRDTDFAEVMANFGVERFIYTAIHTDGMMSGPAISELKRFARSTPARVTASGGVRSLADVTALQSLEKYGVDSVIAGRALYEGSLDLEQSIRALKGAE